MAALWILSCRCEAGRGRGQFHGRPPRRECKPWAGCQPWVSESHGDPAPHSGAGLCFGGAALVKEKGSDGENQGAFSGSCGHFPREALAFCTPARAARPLPGHSEQLETLTLRRLMPASLVGGVKCSSSSKWMSPRRQACANSCPLPSKTRGQPRCRPGKGKGNTDTDTGGFAASRGSQSRSGSNNSWLVQQHGVKSKHLETAA